MVATVSLKFLPGVPAMKQQLSQLFRMHIQQTKVESRATGGPQ
jgi:hypothetical protein